MVSNVDRIYETRRSRSRTPSRVVTPQVKKVKPTKKKSATKATTRARSKTPTRNITTSTPKPSVSKTTKASTAKKATKSSAQKVTRKRKSIVLNNDLEDEIDNELDYKPSETKKTKSPKNVSKTTGRPRKSLTNEKSFESGVRRSRRLRDLNSVSITSESKSRKSLSINGGISGSPSTSNTSRSEALEENAEGHKWGWFSCAVM